MADTPYSITLSLNILNHLGLNLYSNVPAVIAEAVANSWDADATSVNIDIDREREIITITDDGHGMTLNDINKKYLTVGYRRRDEGAAKTPGGRQVMGRKGIGKLSLFSVASVIELYTVKGGEKNGFRMVLEEIRQRIKQGTGTYYPAEIPKGEIGLQSGTKLVLLNLKKTIHQVEKALRKRLSRRFSIIGEEHNFSVFVNKSPISIADRDYYHKIQYLWWYGKDSEKYRGYCDALKYENQRPNSLPSTDYQVGGWIGTVEEAGKLKDENDNLNKIIVTTRGKLAQEDILDDFNEGGMYSKYLIGEIHADFLDADDKEDIATSARQKIIEDDPRYQALRSFVYGELKHIQGKWSDLRNLEGEDKALEIPAIKQWFETLRPDHKKKARSLFGRINRLTVDSKEDRARLFKYGVLAFESLKYKENLNALNEVSPKNLEAIASIIANLDDIEATLYHQIVRERIQIIKTLNEKVSENVREKVIQRYLFDHLWLLDPSWERATAPHIEESVEKEFNIINAGLDAEEKAGRVDIKYRTTAGKHVIIELKRANRVVSSYELLGQVAKYSSALRKLLDAAGRKDEPIEVVCVVGRKLSDWSEPNGRTESDNMLWAKHIRVKRYDELIDNAYNQYKEFLTKQKEAGRIYDVIKAIEVDESF